MPSLFKGVKSMKRQVARLKKKKNNGWILHQELSFKSVSWKILKFMMTLAPLNRLKQQGRYLKHLRKVEWFKTCLWWTWFDICRHCASDNRRIWNIRRDSTMLFKGSGYSNMFSCLFIRPQQELKAKLPFANEPRIKNKL